MIDQSPASYRLLVDIYSTMGDSDAAERARMMTRDRDSGRAANTTGS